MNEFRDTDIGYVSPIRSVDAERANVVHLHRANALPLGCDYQGRHPEAAECATDVGADDWQPLTAWENARFWSAVLAAALVVVGLGLFFALN